MTERGDLRLLASKQSPDACLKLQNTQIISTFEPALKLVIAAAFKGMFVLHLGLWVNDLTLSDTHHAEHMCPML